MITEPTYDKIKGLFFGQAIGDALGLGAEFLTKEQTRKIYPEGLSEYSQIIRDRHRRIWDIGEWTDDTDQFLAIVDAILQNDQLSEIGFAEQLFKWYNGNPRGIGSTTRKVLSVPQFVLNPLKASEHIWRMSNNQLAANGAVMRTSVLGIWDYKDKEKVKQNSELICKVTHFDPRCVGSCVIITSIISNMLDTGKFLSKEEILTIADQYDDRIKDYVITAFENDISQLELGAPHSIGYTLKTLSAGLWAYFNAKDFEDGILQVINEGGDTDTNAAVAGSLLGAKFGYKNIPEKYIDGLKGKNLLMEKMESLVDKLK